MKIKDLAKRALPLKDILIIDAHSHLGPWYNFYIPQPNLNSMINLMNHLGIDKCCVAPHVSIGPDYRLGNKMVYKAMRKYPKRILGLVTVNPHYPEEMEEELKKYTSLGFVGIKIHPDSHNYPILGENYKTMWRWANKRGKIVLGHCWEGNKSSPKMYGEIAKEYPRVKIILGHSGGTNLGYQEAIKVAKLYKNTYLEICGSEFSCLWLDSFIEKVGAEKVLYGSDSPFIDPRYTLGKIAYSRISEEKKRKILGLNMERLLGSGV